VNELIAIPLLKTHKIILFILSSFIRLLMTKYTKVQARTKVMKKLTLLSQAILPSTKLYNG
jgi:hypothetical protein